MTHLGDNQRSSTRAGFTAWLSLAAVLLLQVGAAAHEAQHSLSELDDVCEICVQLETGSAADSAANHSVAPLATTAGINVWTDAPVVLSPYRTPQLRAPPALI